MEPVGLLPRSQEPSYLLRFFIENDARISLLPHACYMPHRVAFTLCFRDELCVRLLSCGRQPGVK
jgi:hypothetical protein